MSYRKWSRIRLPFRPIAPLGGGAAGCSGAQGDDNNEGRGALDYAFRTHIWLCTAGCLSMPIPWVLGGGQNTEFLWVCHLPQLWLLEHSFRFNTFKLVKMDALKHIFPSRSGHFKLIKCDLYTSNLQISVFLSLEFVYIVICFWSLLYIWHLLPVCLKLGFHPAWWLWMHIRPLWGLQHGATEQPQTQTGEDTAVSLAVSVTRLKNSRSAVLLSLVMWSHPDRNTYCTTSWCVNLCSVPYMALEKTVPVWQRYERQYWGGWPCWCDLQRGKHFDRMRVGQIPFFSKDIFHPEV